MRSDEAPVEVALCVDFGSTFTKALLVDLAEGQVVAGAERPTTVGTDVLDGYAACRAALVAQDRRAEHAEVFACSSAGGGLRIAVVGNEALVTAEAGRRVALSSGGKVVTVRSVADGDDLDLTDAAPDVVLLTGGTDGGNAEPLLAAARGLVEAGWRGPVVVAGNADAAAAVSELLDGVPHRVAANVVPRIGVLEPSGAREAIRAVFLEHVIGGKELSASPAFAAMVQGPTPDLVLTGVELLARVAGDVVVVDVGGATTDVHSVVEVDPEQREREVVATTPVTRTVEGDLGMRWSAVSTVETAGLCALSTAARRRREEPGWVPQTDQDAAEDEAIARAAVELALQRHAGRARVVLSPEGRVVERTGKDLREVDLLVGSGGVLRHGRPGVAERVLALGDPGDWQLPRRAAVTVDAAYVLAAAGLLAAPYPDVATRLVSTLAEAAPHRVTA